MTTAGGGSAGGSGFDYGENTVAARLSIDIPAEGVQSLREITQEISRFRTEMEAAARSQGDFIGFFETLPSIAGQAANAFKTYADELERGLATQERMANAVGRWDVQPGSTPEVFKGMSTGMGRSSGEVQDQVADLDRLRGMGAAGERQYLNVQQQNGALSSGDMPSSNSQAAIADATERISMRDRVNQERSGGSGGFNSGGGIANQIMNQFGIGNSQMGMLQQGGIGGMSGAVPQPNSGSSGAVGAPAGGAALGMLGRMGPLGMGLTGAAAGYGLTQFAGERLQGLKDVGLTTGGGIKEGAEAELQARIMGMSPFLTNDQSRSIIQNALRDGYKGKEYETVTKFMADNMKDFAMTVTESREALKTQMLGGGSPEAFASSMEVQKKLSEKGYLSFQDRSAAMRGMTQQMVASGANVGDALNTSAAELEMYSDDPNTKGLVSDFGMAARSTMGGQMMQLIAAGIQPSTDYGEWGEQLAAAPDASSKTLQSAYRQSGGKKGIFHTILTQQYGMQISQGAASALFEKIKSGGGVLNEYATGTARVNEAVKSESSVSQRSFGESLNAGVGSTVGAIGGSLADIATGNLGNIPQRFRAGAFQSSTDHIDILDQIVKSNGNDPNNIMVQGSSGSSWEKLQPGDKSQLEALANGGRWKRSGEQGNGLTLADSSRAGGGFGSQDVSVQGEVSLHVTTDPGVNVQGAPKTIQLTQNQVRANAGWGNSTVNAPPPGDR
jgi:hypothetical protein